MNILSDAAADVTSQDASTPPDVTATDATANDVSLSTNVRGRRYCEVLSGMVTGATVRLDVYNTYGLNDCPDDAWRRLDVAALRTELGTPVVVLNGPRYWTLDAFDMAAVQDPTVRTIGGIPMRIAGRVEVPLAAAASSAPYTDRSIRRDTTVRFAAGGRVFELLDNAGHVYVMQSFSVQRTAQTIESLSTLGARLMVPMGWSFRSRVLTDDLRIVAEGGMATVLTDDFNNTYQRSQQTP